MPHGAQAISLISVPYPQADVYAVGATFATISMEQRGWDRHPYIHDDHKQLPDNPLTAAKSHYSTEPAQEMWAPLQIWCRCCQLPPNQRFTSSVARERLDKLSGALNVHEVSAGNRTLETERWLGGRRNGKTMQQAGAHTG